MSASGRKSIADLEKNSQPGKAAPRSMDEEAREKAPLLSGKPVKSSASSYDAFNPVAFVMELSEHFGHKLLTLLFVVQHCLKGLSFALLDRAQPYLLRQYHVAGPEAQVVASVIMLPWALKPMIGLVSDVFPIRGYNKAPYMMMASVLGATACLLVGLLGHSSLSVPLVIVFCFLFHLQLATCDLLSEAKYAEKMQQNPKMGPALLSYVWFGLNCGSFVATVASGPIVHAWGPKAMYIIAAIPAASVVIPVYLGYLDETKVSDEALQKMRQRYYEQKEACALCFLMLVCSIAVMICGLVTQDPVTNSIVAIVVGAVLLFAFTLVLAPIIALVNAFNLLQTALSLNTAGAAFYFYTDTADMYPEGPHFSDYFFNSVLGVAGTVFSLIGIYSYQRYMSNWKYRHILILTNVILSVFSAMDIIVFARLNRRVGIPDHWFVIGLSCIQQAVQQWRWMPQVVILSYLCPKGMEATMYALLAGCSNMGQTISGNIGGLLLQRLGVQPRGLPGESEQFRNLWIAAAISTALPLLAILLLFWMLPDARQNEKILDATEEATTGSLLNRLRGK